jgi:hypothetical protein
MHSDGIITVQVDARHVREAILDLRCASLRSLALCRDIIDRLAERRDPVPEVSNV